jgi:hypothetical protein
MKHHLSRIFALCFALTFLPAAASAQATISTGDIVGTVTDQSGAVVPGAHVTVINEATRRQLDLNTNTAGLYESGALTPGDYTVRVGATGFTTTEIHLTVQVSNTSNGNVALRVGETTTTVEVQAAGVQVNTEQATVQGVITTQQIENLPINGSNFLQLAQLEPGVQIQDGAVFDPTKNGFSSISFGGKYGRSARIELDGGDVSDENVGTTTMNIPASAIQEFQIEQSSLDLSSGMTSSGAVNITTRSGSNQYHGEAFDYGRWHNLAARVAPEDLFFRREQFGGNVGGAIIKDKLFFFGDWERNRQDYLAPVELGGNFAPLSSSINQPFREHEAFGRLDWQATKILKLFYRYTYNENSNVVPFIPNTFSPFKNFDHAQDHLGGVDWVTGNFTHSFRVEFLTFANHITGATEGYDPAPGLELAIGSDPDCLTGGADVFCSGPNFLAPQITQQHDLEFKYDGSTIRGKHMIRYGMEVNRILGGGYASFLASAPAVQSYPDDATAAASGPFPGGAGNPLNYPVETVTLGNGVGYGTSIPRFGFPGGGQFDTRFAAYIGDNWRIRPNLNISIGLHYIRDTGRSDSYLGPSPAINAFGPGLGNQVKQPNLDFAPQLGIAWDPKGNGKTVFRAGAGIYYENTVWNNVLFDPAARLQKGLFLGFTGGCGTITLPTGGTINATNICGQPVGTVASQIEADQAAYQAATIAAGPAANGTYVGSIYTDNAYTGTTLFAPNFRTPYSEQFNVGVQREIHLGTVLSVDYLRNHALHYLMLWDSNHVGAARFLEKNAATNAINTTNSSFGCPAGPGGIQCAIAAGATIDSYAANGLDSGAAYLLGYPASVSGLTPDTGAAFPGANPAVGQNLMTFPIGHSIYNGLDVSLKQQLKNPLRGVKAANLQVSYSLSRLNTMALDQDFGGNVTDWDNYNHYIGPSALDRTNQFSAGGVLTLAKGFQVSLIAHADSSLPANLELSPGQSRVVDTSGQIFQTDLTGDGTMGDILPGTNLGAFGRSVNPGNINKFIDAYNSKYAGQLTPAGQALVSAGLMTAAQMQQLGAVTPTLADAPAGQVGMGGLFTADLGLTYIAKIRENLTIQPSITFYNVTNSQNFDQGSSLLSGALQPVNAPAGTSGYANDTTYGQRTTRVTLGSGLYGLGGPRVIEFGLKLTF